MSFLVIVNTILLKFAFRITALLQVVNFRVKLNVNAVDLLGDISCFVNESTLSCVSWFTKV